MDREQKGKHWKDHLLRSGVPLEYQVARLLAAERMSVNADYSFIRRDVSGLKEWSVDIAATYYHEDRKGHLQYELELLVECKFRSREKSILFLSDPNVDFQPSVGSTIYRFDYHTPYHLASSSLDAFDQHLPFVYKGIELHSGAAVEEDLRHGIQQLRYATPPMMRQSLDFAMTTDMDEAMPLFTLSILVTNAPIRVLREDVSISSIESAENIADISETADAVIYYSDYGPDFEEHFRSVFSDEAAKSRIASARTISDVVHGRGKETSSLTDLHRVMEELQAGNTYQMRRMCTQFLIVNERALPNLIRQVKAACTRSYRDRKKYDPVARVIRKRSTGNP